MNWKQRIILVVYFFVTALILWQELPIEFPWVIMKVLMLFLKLFAALAICVIAYILAGGKKRQPGGMP